MSDRDVLQDLNRAYIRSVQDSDVRWFDAHLSADFLNTNPDGSMVDRAGFLKQIAPPCAVTNLREEDVLIRVFGDVALIHARTVYTKPDGQPGRGRYTDTWVRQEGRWLCVAAHVTRG
ncbi:MAG TPA: nuclear transport factor 2 family protein [Terriglobales bacterium]|nr:nuclear transport factor 2 family protein [Terriglobales bacterium]